MARACRLATIQSYTNALEEPERAERGQLVGMVGGGS